MALSRKRKVWLVGACIFFTTVSCYSIYYTSTSPLSNTGWDHLLWVKNATTDLLYSNGNISTYIHNRKSLLDSIDKWRTQRLSPNAAKAESISTSSSSSIVTPQVSADRPELSLIRRNTPLNHVAFIKTHKSASSTIQNILMRYGLNHNLTFVLPVSGAKTGWPDPFDPEKHMRPIKQNKADILCFHSVFSPKIEEVMPNDTFYLSILREPFSRLKSAYTYYNFYKCSKLSLREIIKQLPKNIKPCEKPVFNALFYDFGFPVETSSESTREINDYIDILDKKFGLVMIVEYFDESLIIMRDLLGWSMEDVLSFASNFRQNNTDSKSDAKSLRGVDIQDNKEGGTLMYQKSKADVILYSHFKRKLERIIKANKSYIEMEKDKLQKLRLEWMGYCIQASVPNKYITDPRFKPWHGYNSYGYILTEEGMLNQTCVALAMSEVAFHKQLANLQPAF